MKVKKIKKETSQFMREYYQGHYEDVAWVIMKNNAECKTAELEYVQEERTFLEQLEKKAPELIDQYSDVIGCLLHFQNSLIDGAYILGVKDRERSLLPQE